VAGLIRQDGTVAATYRYDPFGRVVDSTGFVYQPLRFKGREQDPQTGLVYMRARWYDPSMGRFISEDPIGLEGGINPYGFGDGDPINHADPSGTCPEGETMDLAIDVDSGSWVATCSGGGWASGKLGVAKLPAVAVTAPRSPGSTSGYNTTPSARGSDIAAYPRQLSGELQSAGYRWAENGSAKSTDCSHFVCRVLNDRGCNVPYVTSRGMTTSSAYQMVPSSQARAGDVMFSPQGHVGIYSGQTDARGRWIGVDWGGRMNNRPTPGSTTSAWGPGGWYEGPISFYRPNC
jgi:RHS repeat-associated protein